MDHVRSEDEVNVYADPEGYDAENTMVDEMPVLLPLARWMGGPILDLACGTGRTTLPLAQAGFEVIGVDMSEPMLARAREKAHELGLAVDFQLQDCRRLDVPVVARMTTMTGNTFQEFLTNDDQTIFCARSAGTSRRTVSSSSGRGSPQRPTSTGATASSRGAPSPMRPVGRSPSR